MMLDFRIDQVPEPLLNLCQCWTHQNQQDSESLSHEEPVHLKRCDCCVAAEQTQTCCSESKKKKSIIHGSELSKQMLLVCVKEPNPR